MTVDAEEVTARLLSEFPQALAGGQLVAYFQPEIDLSSGAVTAAETLARWEHPELGTLSPVLFGPLAERLGLMGELTRLMLSPSLAQHRAWAADGWTIPAQAWREYVRPDDIAGRYGGDEFIIVIPGTTRLRAAEIAGQLTGPPARVPGSDGKLVGFTVSVGVAESGCCPDLPSLLAHADHAMYEAKRAGGGCFRIFDNAQHAPDPALP